MPTNGSGGQVQGQSLLKVTVAPAFNRLFHWSDLFEGPEKQQKLGCMLAMTLS